MNQKARTVTGRKPAAMRESRDIEWLVNWALEKQRATGSQGSGGADGGPAWMALGTRIDSSGWGSGGLSGRFVHEDAQIIADELGRMAAMPSIAAAAGLVHQHGRLGTRPEWGREGCGRYVLQRRNNGQGKAIKRWADQRRQRQLLGFEWKWVGHSVENLERMMLEYAAWHAALQDLREIVNPKMSAYVATGPGCPAEPWDDPAYLRLIGQLGELEVDEVA